MNHLQISQMIQIALPNGERENVKADLVQGQLVRICHDRSINSHILKCFYLL